MTIFKWIMFIWYTKQDEKNHIVTTNRWLNQNWLFFKLTWYPWKYANITVIVYIYTDVWKPDVVLYNKCVNRCSIYFLTKLAVIKNREALLTHYKTVPIS